MSPEAPAPIVPQAPAREEETPSRPSRLRALPSGRAIELCVGEGREELLVRAPSGDVEVKITFGREGPVVTVRGGRLEIETPEEIALSCRSLDVRTRESLRLRSDRDAEIHAAGDLRVKTAGDVRMNGAFIRLNCDENGSNPPPPVPGETPVQALERLLTHAKSLEAVMGPDLGAAASAAAAKAAAAATGGASDASGCCGHGHGHDAMPPGEET